MYAFLHMIIRISQVAQQRTALTQPHAFPTIKEQCTLPFNASQSMVAALQKHHKKIQTINQAGLQDLFTYSLIY